MENKLKECPLCGSNPELITRGNEYTKKRSAEIYCKQCCMTMVVGAVRFPLQWAIKKVSEKWNTRHPVPSTTGQLERTERPPDRSL